MGMFSLHTAQEGDGFCVPEMNVLWCKMCLSTQEQKQNTTYLADKSVIIHSETSPVPTWTDRPLSQEEAITLKAA